MARKTLLLIMGSTRAGRQCPQVATWVASIGQAHPDWACEIVDLANWWLPMDDEPDLPAVGRYIQAHTRAWSDKIKAANGIIFVTPQFNWGYPAVLKNAIDHLYHEWRDKPTVIVTYGGHGGTRCEQQLRCVAASLKMRVVTTSPALTLPDAVIRQGARLDADQDFAAFEPAMLRAFSELEEQLAGDANIQ